MATMEATGKWLARRRTPEGKRIAARGNTPEEAEHLADAKLRGFSIPLFQPLTKTPTLHECAVSIWEPRILQTKPSTQRRYAACYAQHIYPYLGNVQIEDLRSSDIQRWVNDITHKQVSKSGKGKVTHQMSARSVGMALDILRQILNLCVDEGIISRTPARRISTPKVPPKREKVLEVEEAREFLESVVGTPIHAPVLLGCILGLRKSEVINLKWDHLDRRKMTLRVAAEGGKTVGSSRTLFLDEAIIEQIDKAGDLDCEYVCSYNGKPLARTTLDRLRRECETFPKGWTFHDLRHGSAGLLYALTNDILVVQSMLGHTKLDTTQLYLTSSKSKKKEGLRSVTKAIFE